MISNITISNYKSIEKVSIDLGRINVFIGENGAGKSNILESIALASAAAEKKLDNEFLASRGIRVTESILMTQGFNEIENPGPIHIKISNDDNSTSSYLLENDFQPYSSWSVRKQAEFEKIASTEDQKVIAFSKIYKKVTGEEVTNNIEINFELLFKLSTEAIKLDDKLALEFLLENFKKHNTYEKEINKLASKFVIYSADNNTLRDFKKNSSISPLGINGEGLFKLIQVESNQSENFLNDLTKFLKHFGWFKNIEVTEDISSQSCVKIIDKYINNENFSIDLRSANEGFLFLIFYFSIFRSKLTPHFFAIDNIDASLNPRLCTALIKELVKLSKENNKQAILTTHNPAILDGLDLKDDEQRLFVIQRNIEGRTTIKRFKQKPSLLEDQKPQKLSQLFMSGALGGVPKLF